MVQNYIPSKKILEKYAEVLVNFAANKTKGIKKGDVVLIQVPECAKPLLIELRKAVIKSGGNPIVQYLPDDMAKSFFELANDEQLKFFPSKYLKGLLAEIDHSIYIIAETNKHELEEINPKKMMMRGEAYKPYSDWRDEKENKGKFSWVLAMYGTPQMAKEVDMSQKDYWDQIIKACYLDEKNPVKKWKEAISEIERIRGKLNSMKIEKIRLQAKGTDLIVGLGKDRKWLGGRGCNIPSFEIFISPDWRKTEGHVTFTEPLYRYGNLVEGIYLEFKNGIVVKATAKKGEKVIKEMIKAKNADKIGEYSLTDSGLSKITKFMGETLFDENVGGKNGNTHIALGKAYRDSYVKNPSKVNKNEWEKMGFNDSSVHTDIVATSNRTVTAFNKGGKSKVIYKDGKFLI